MIGEIFLLFLGGFFIYAGAEGLVWGGSKLAIRFHVAPIVIGLSVVAFGTSLPEFTVSLYSTLHDVPDIAIGNIIGSNIANVGLILATAAIIFPISVKYGEIRQDVLIVIFITVLFIVLSMDGALSRIDGGILVTAIVLYLWRLATSQKVDTDTDDKVEHPLWHFIGALVLGLGLLVLGTTLFTDSAIKIARFYHVPELVIGATIVAVGTSLPELATSLVAAFHRQSGIVLGNILGSNVFNLLAVLGIITIVQPITVAPAAIAIQMPLMLVLTAVLIPALKWQGGVTRGMGMALLLVYISFTIYVYMNGGSSS